MTAFALRILRRAAPGLTMIRFAMFHYLRIPVRLGAILPTMAPGGVPRRWLVGAPLKLCEPPPWGWSTGFIATPRTRGQRTPLARMAWNFLPALRNGLSPRPPPATRPMVARARGWNSRNLP